MEIEKYKWVMAIAVLIGLVLAAIVIARDVNYQKLIDQKEAEISKLSKQVFQKEADAQFWKSQAEEIAKKVAVVSKKIDASKKVASDKKKQMDSIIVPTESSEIVERLKEQYPSVEVKCE